MAKHLRGDPRLPVVDIDCREHEDSDRVLCNVEFDDACDMFRVVREPDGELSLGRPEVSLCTYSTFSGFPG